MIYFDNAAATPINPEVKKEMEKLEAYGNPASLHKIGEEAKEIIFKSKEKISKALGRNANEIIFTSGATEANNLAIKGIAFANKNKKHILISSIEHPSVISAANWLKDFGFEIEKVKVDKYGFVDLEDLKNKLKKDTLLVSIIHGNHEIGTVQNLKEISKIVHENGSYFHTDAAMTFGKMKINIENVDLLSASSSKLYGPHGIGFLYIKSGIKIKELTSGISNPNLRNIYGFSKAIEIAEKRMEEDEVKLRELEKRIINGVLKIKESHLNGHPEKRIAGLTNFWFKGLEGEAMVLLLNEFGFATSTGSACSTASLRPSHILLAIGLKPEQAHGSLRISLGRQNKKEEVDEFLEVLPKVIEKLRSISPTWRG